jgi:2,3-dihydroxybenzoate-AMP ligase
MPVKFSPWPTELEQVYRNAGYWRDEPLTQMLATQAECQPEKLAVISSRHSMTYVELDAQSDILAKQLLARGLKAGDTALVQLPNMVEFYLVFFALMKAGIVPVNALFSHNKIELNEYTRQIKPKLAIFSGQHVLFGHANYLVSLLADSAIEQLIFVDSLDTEVRAVIEPLASTLMLDDLLDFDEVPHQHVLPTINPNEVAFFQLSGGSTGTPKLIPRTHNDYLYSVIASAEICGVNRDTRYLCALPCAHNFPLSSPGALGVFYAGGTVVMAADPSPMVCFPLIEKHHITMSGLVPTALTMWIDQAKQTPFNLSSLERLQVGGAKLHPDVASMVTPHLGCQLQQVFGMAEGLVNYTRLDDDEWTVIHTQGRPISPADEIRVVDEQGQCVAAGVEGALLTRGPYTIRGYYDADTHNQTAFTADGFYRSGDRVRLTENGYLIVCGREKDQVNRGGEKIAAQEVESWLLIHPLVKNAALVGIEDSVMGERACMFVVAETLPLKAVTLRKFLREQGLADYKIPDKFEFVDSLPLTPIGKIDKKKLKNLLIEQTRNSNMVNS